LNKVLYVNNVLTVTQHSTVNWLFFRYNTWDCD